MFSQTMKAQYRDTKNTVFDILFVDKLGLINVDICVGLE